MSPLVLVRGDLTLALPAAERLAAALGEAWGVEPVRVRHPGELAALAADLRTFSLFAPGKIVVAAATGALADRDAAEELLADARAALPFAPGAALEGKAREAAVRLLQVVRLHDLDPAGAPPERVLAGLPDALFGRKKSAAEEARAELAPLLAAALDAGLVGVGAAEASILADLLRDGLPPRHLMILVESAVDGAHPLVEALERRDAVVEAGRLESDRGGRVAGLERLVAELSRETGVAIAADAASELARRTLRPEDVRRGGEQGAIEGDSVARFAAEYRKLATLAEALPPVAGKLASLAGERERIDRALVVANVEDRGQEAPWPILDALADGDAAKALAAIGRRVRGADDPIAERLSLFGLLAGFVRQLVAVHGALAATGAPAGVTSYPRFRDQVAPRLKGKIEGLASNPLARVNEYRMHRPYLAAGRREAAAIARLPGRLLDAERRLKGDSDDPDAVLTELVLALAGSAPAKGAARAR